MPELSAPISQGVTGGILQHKVPPVYPLEARRVRLEGNVVLEAVVTAQGRVEDLKQDYHQLCGTAVKQMTHRSGEVA